MSHSFPKLSHYDVPVVYILDHDSTRGLTRAAMSRLKQLASNAPFDINLERLEAAHQDAKSKSLPFDALQYIHLELRDTPELYEQFKAVFIAGNPSEVVYPEIPAFDASLNTFPPIPHLILTAGSPDFQQLKLQASAYRGYAKIVPVGSDGHTLPKGPVIRSWQSADGSFELLGLDDDGQPLAHYRATRAHLIDDKVVSFEDMPAGSTGSLVTHQSFGDIRSASQGLASELPDHVQKVDDLSHISIERAYAQAPGPETERIKSFIPIKEYGA